MASGGVSLVVGAGGPTGGPFIWAALEALEKRTGFVASSASEIIGTSAGAFVAASFTEQTRLRPGVVLKLQKLANDERFAPSTPVRLAGALRHATRRIVARTAPTNKEIAEYDVPERPYHPGASAVTVSRTGERVRHRLIESDDVEAVVRASSAIPWVNHPIELDGVLHVDGAVYSPTNIDLIGDPEVVVVIAPMVSASGGGYMSYFHRAALRAELATPIHQRIPVVIVMPSEAAHADRRNREPFVVEGAAAVGRL